MSGSVNKVVLPKPAGAQIRVSLRPIPSLNRSTRRGRATRARACGMYSLVVRSWLATTPSSPVKRKRFETLTGDYTWAIRSPISRIRRYSGRMPPTGSNGCCFGGLGSGVPGDPERQVREHDRGIWEEGRGDTLRHFLFLPLIHEVPRIPSSYELR